MSPSASSSAPAAPKIAIKGFSLSSYSNKKPAPKSTLGKRPRASFLADDDHEHSSSEDEGGAFSKSSSVAAAKSSRKGFEEVSSFENGGAVSKREELEGARRREELVIPKLGNRDWRGEIRRRRGGKDLLPREERARREAERNAGAGGEEVDVVNGEGSQPDWGLSVRKKVKVEEGPEGSTETVETTVVETATNTANGDGGVGTEEVAKTETKTENELPKPKTDDELALEALLCRSSGQKRPDLVIPAAAAPSEDRDEAPINEDDAYRRAIAAAPDVSTLEDYERVPVEEFGAALLRGMGWKEGSGKVERPKEVKRRQNLLGLGATKLKDAEELGAWVQRSDKKNIRDGKRRDERRPKLSEYNREKEKRDERREERYGGGYRDRDRDRDGHRDRDSYRERDRDRRR